MKAYVYICKHKHKHKRAMHDPEIQSFNLSFKFVLFYRMLIFVSFKTGDNGDFNVQI